mmetsp:Transcript_12308/g.15598  ORF Transcript_12308/g.15598 Transcript_12308/m.15598 type:complete len:601 (+) Transcript_12308:93-1895(+)
MSKFLAGTENDTSATVLEPQTSSEQIDSEWVEVEVPPNESEDPRQSEEQIICITAIPAIDRYSFNNVHETYAGIKLLAKEVNFEERKRKALDLVVVLDKSGSMSGEKLDMCKETIKFLLTQLQDEDKFALVTFDTFVEAFPFEKMTDEGKNKTVGIVENVTPGSATNLSGGLFEATRLVMNSKIEKNANEIQSVLLLTDGLANNGICDTSELVNELQIQISDLPALSIFTFGYGENHNDEMLRAISDQGSGMYNFIEDEESISAAFGSCLGGLLSVVAQNISIVFKVCDDSILLKRVCTKCKVQEISEGKEYMAMIGDMFAGENKDIVVNFQMTAVDNPFPTTAINCRLEYRNMLSETNESHQIDLELVRSNSDEAAVHNLQVINATNRVVAAESLDEATNIAKKSNLSMRRSRTVFSPMLQTKFSSSHCSRKSSRKSFPHLSIKIAQTNIPVEETLTEEDERKSDADPLGKAREVLQGGIDKIKNTFSILQGSEYLDNAVSLVKDLEECKESLRTRESYVSKGTKTLSSYAQGHWKQRANRSRVNDTSAGMYQTSTCYAMQMNSETYVKSNLNQRGSYEGHEKDMRRPTSKWESIKIIR